MAIMGNELGAWEPYLQDTLAQDWCQTLLKQVEEAYTNVEPAVYPPRTELFAALRLTPPEQVRCVILGQDPYHEQGQAHGLAFSVNPGVKLPPSLKNIYQELQTDVGVTPPDCGDLRPWAKNGVLLLNNVLTVYDGVANSHKKWGWQKFTDAVLSVVQQMPQPVAYILWGKEAQTKEARILSKAPVQTPRLVLKGCHPSPLSVYRGFYGSRPFSQVNRFLVEHGSTEIDWSL